jgi:DNA-binding transcriptional LysR family regulator
MERLRRLAQFWNWLPAFRAVAETEHLPSAAAKLGMSAPGLSRMVKLIESEIGQPLFERRARRLILNEAGMMFLRHVRDAMRRVDDGLQELADLSYSGSIKIASSNSAAMVYVLPAIERLAVEHPRELFTLDEREIGERLLTGQLDIALLEQVEARDDLDVEQLGSMSYGIYCSSGHPLKNESPAAEISLERCLDYPFVAASRGAHDAWPLNLRRIVGLRVNALNLAMAACASGRLLALLPDAVASRYPAQLIRLGATMADHPVFIAHRPLLSDVDRVGALIEALHAIAIETS